eukprot:COSAG01_NODE_2740_length_7158_cov_3.142371_3_plen_71_part_00
MLSLHLVSLCIARGGFLFWLGFYPMEIYYGVLDVGTVVIRAVHASRTTAAAAAAVASCIGFHFGKHGGAQ